MLSPSPIILRCDTITVGSQSHGRRSEGSRIATGGFEDMDRSDSDSGRLGRSDLGIPRLNYQLSRSASHGEDYWRRSSVVPVCRKGRLQRHRPVYLVSGALPRWDRGRSSEFLDTEVRVWARSVLATCAPCTGYSAAPRFGH